MGDLHKGNISFERSFTLLHSLFEYGVQHIVISPGSRSTPLTLAAAHHPGLSKHILIDERSAAFFALGMGKSTGIPAVLICTSGTAVANYFPAVIEAARSSTPLILLTADRPPRDRISGAPQTINQIKIFGDYPLFFQDAPEPDPSDENSDIFRLITDNIWHISTTGTGPVHVNLPFDKPLEPDTTFVESVLLSAGLHPENSGKKKNSSGGQRAIMVGNAAIKGNTDILKSETKSPMDAILKSRHPLVILGPSNHTHDFPEEAIKKLAEAGFPVIRCAGAPATGYDITGYDSFLRHIRNEPNLKPDLIMRTGLHPASRGMELFFEACSDAEHIHFSGNDDFNDAFRTVSRKAQLGELAAISDMVGAKDPAWLKLWMDQQNRFLEYRAVLLNNTDVLTDGHVFNRLTGLLPDNWLAVLSNSFPIRDYDLFKTPDSNHKTITNRGASGIDGIISTAAGASLASERNAVLFIGDIAALHDSNAWVLNNQFNRQTLIVVIINNGGGNIFRMLPIAGHQQIFKHYFETPQNVKFESIAHAYDVKYKKVTSAEDLPNVWNELSATPGLHIMECVTDADESMGVRTKLWDLPS
ncbi:MAG: 2-succinyl-5-enolpyruvyl-6-hydroxy-3-cyclohexene-1-carboxylic-acid synthase [Cyclonatronaceae bacterium]